MKQGHDPGGVRPTIVIVGNVNVGKTTLFSKICVEKEVFKQPGNTVAILKGHVKKGQQEIQEIIDTPGTCSIFTKNEDERISRDVLLSIGPTEKVDGALLVADAKKLKRSIALFLQYAEYNIPMLLDINMVDEIESRGIKIDYKKLSEILGVEVCTSVATAGIGIRDIKSKLDLLRIPKKLVKYPEKIEEFCGIVEKLLSSTTPLVPRGIALLLLVGDKSIERWVATTFGQGMLDQIKNLGEQYRREQRIPFEVILTGLYNTMTESIVKQVQDQSKPPKNRFLEKFAGWCSQLSTGIPIAIGVIALMYLFLGVFGAGWLVDVIKGSFFDGLLMPWLRTALEPLPIVFVKDMLTNKDFGVLPTGVFLALGLVAPVLFCFYLFFGFLEDSGYLSRLTLLLDKAFQKIGLNGKGVLPLVLGFSCITMAILTTRCLDSKREKNIATFLLFFGIPCAPLLAILFVLLERLPISATLTVFGIMFLQIFLAGFILNKLLPGRRTPLLIEIPPIRLPRIVSLVKKSVTKTYFFMKEAIPVFVFASFLVFIIHWFGGLDMLERAIKPFTGNLLGLPEKSIQVFIKLIIRKENGATELEHIRGGYTNLQLVTNILVMMLIPCINAVIVLFKERGAKTAILILGVLVGYILFLGSFVNHVCLFLGVTFS